jgi:hypothetical protein
MARHHFLFTLLALVVMTALLARAQDVAAQPEDSAVALASTDASPAAEALGKEAVDAVAAACALAQNCSQCKVHATPHRCVRSGLTTARVRACVRVCVANSSRAPSADGAARATARARAFPARRRTARSPTRAKPSTTHTTSALAYVALSPLARALL